MYTSIEKNPPESWYCCVNTSCQRVGIYSFLERYIKSSEEFQKCRTTSKSIGTTIKFDNYGTYSIIYKAVNGCITPICLYPKPPKCECEYCKFLPGFKR